jgi:hypothetical protein
MSLLDYAGSVLGWHSDWPEARPSVWHELPLLAEVEAVTSRQEYAELRLGIFIPALVEHEMAAKAPHVNYCGGCFRRFEAIDAARAANALRHHIEVEPCAHYVALADQGSVLSPGVGILSITSRRHRLIVYSI